MDTRDRNAIRREIDRLVQSWRREESREFEMSLEKGVSRGVLIWAMTKHSVELTESILILDKADKTKYAGSLVRLLLECAITTTWLAVQDDSDSALLHAHFRNRGNVLKDFPAPLHEANPEVLRLIEDELREYEEYKRDEGKYIEKRAKALAGGEELYLYYRILSANSHAGVSIAEGEISEVQKTEKFPLGIRLGNEGDPEFERNLLGMTLIWLIMCMRAHNVIDARGRHKTQVEDAIRRVGTNFPFGLATSTATK